MEYFKAAKDAFNKLKVDPQNPAFAEEILDKKLLVRLKKPKYSREKQFFKNVNDLFSSKTYTYPIRSWRQIRQKLEQFYNEFKEKRKGKKMRLQVDHEFQQLKIKDLNKVHNVEMFSILLRGGEAFAAEQKIRELKRRVA